MAETVIFQDAQATVTNQRIQWGAAGLALSAVAGASVVTIPGDRATHIVRACIGGALVVLFGNCAGDKTASGDSAPLSGIATLGLIGALILALLSAAKAYTAGPRYAVVAATTQGAARIGSYKDVTQAQALMGAVMQALTQRT